MDLTLVFVYGGLTVGISFLCSLLEAALLSVRKSTLTEQRDGGSRGAGVLLDLKQHHLNDAISAILTLNTISNTAGAGLATYQAKEVFDSVPVGVFSGILTFLVLVLSEIIPKSVGANHAAKLTGFVGPTVKFLMRLMRPVLFFTRALTRLLAPSKGNPVSRGELAAMVAMAGHEGTLQGHESQLFENLLGFEEIQVQHVMTPRTVAFMLSADTTIQEFLETEQALVYSRIPVFRESRDQVVGYVFHKDILRALARGASLDTPLSDYMRDVWFIPELASMVGAIHQFQEHREPIAMVVDEHDGLAGLLTLEDLMETMLGVEIIDESDQVADLRQVATRLRDQRIERMTQNQTFLPAREETDSQSEESPSSS